MSDLFDDFNKIFKKDLVPIFVKYLKDPNNKITDNLNDLLNDPQTLLSDVFEKFSKNKDNATNEKNYNDIENVTDINLEVDDEYDELFTRLILIEENMMKIEKILKDKN
tara:strand:- start:366 stop:692 length:327 start_codon:yes stop_codon:yes gene_type:complete